MGDAVGMGATLGRHVNRESAGCRLAAGRSCRCALVSWGFLLSVTGALNITASRPLGLSLSRPPSGVKVSCDVVEVNGRTNTYYGNFEAEFRNFWTNGN
jgi:hypothetical protein